MDNLNITQLFASLVALMVVGAFLFIMLGLLNKFAEWAF